MSVLDAGVHKKNPSGELWVWKHYIYILATAVFKIHLFKICAIRRLTIKVPLDGFGCGTLKEWKWKCSLEKVLLILFRSKSHLCTNYDVPCWDDCTVAVHLFLNGNVYSGYVLVFILFKESASAFLLTCTTQRLGLNSYMCTHMRRISSLCVSFF